jgi:hypothetical protein
VKYCLPHEDDSYSPEFSTFGTFLPNGQQNLHLTIAGQSGFYLWLHTFSIWSPICIALRRGVR